jgi:hypothetical protein
MFDFLFQKSAKNVGLWLYCLIFLHLHINKQGNESLFYAAPS